MVIDNNLPLLSTLQTVEESRDYGNSSFLIPNSFNGPYWWKSFDLIGNFFLWFLSGISMTFSYQSLLWGFDLIYENVIEMQRASVHFDEYLMTAFKSNAKAAIICALLMSTLSPFPP